MGDAADDAERRADEEHQHEGVFEAQERDERRDALLNHEWTEAEWDALPDASPLVPRQRRGEMQKMLDDLRARGFKVKVEQRRVAVRDLPRLALVTPREMPDAMERWAFPLHVLRVEQSVASPNGGQTFVQVIAPDGRVFEGVATCSPKDTFVKKVGMVKACGRLRGQLQREGILQYPPQHVPHKERW